MPLVPKRPHNQASFARHYIPFESARAAMQQFLSELPWVPGDVILLPAYIGWSSREGSGVFDPITALELRPVFYRLDENLAVDVADVQRKLAAHRPRAVLLVHYFGFVDGQFSRLVEICRAAGATILEDAAHAMLTDLVGGRCGRDGDACLYSLHKMLPYETGGALVLNLREPNAAREERQGSDGVLSRGPWHYDLLRIAEVRRRNATTLIKLINEAGLPVDLLHPEIPAGIVPQTLPIKLRAGDRDKLYEQMNAAGYGVTSLYHTLVSTIPRDEFADCFNLSRRIMNLPVHQDVDAAHLPGMVKTMGNFIGTV